MSYAWSLSPHLRRELDSLNPRQVETVSFRPRRDLFAWPLGAAVLLAVFGLGLIGLLAVQILKAHGARVIGFDFDSDRVRSPLLRASVRGEERWTEVTWDEALGHVAEKMAKIKAEYGPEAVALFSHGVGGTFLKHTLKAYGSPNISAPSFAQCRGPRDVGFELTFGDPVGSPEPTDIRNSRCLVLIGSHLGENMHNSQVQEFAHAVGNGASVIVVDPRDILAR